MVLIKKRTKLGKVQHFLTKLQMFSKPAHNKNTALYIFSTEVPLYSCTEVGLHILNLVCTARNMINSRTVTAASIHVAAPA